VNHKGEVVEDLLSALIDEGNKDIKQVLLSKRLKEKTEKAQEGLVEVPVLLF